MNITRQITWIWKPVVFVLCLVPLGHLLLQAFGLISPGLGANPIETIQDRMGIWGLRLILITLSVTPLRKISGWNWLLRFRRMLGLFAFFYVSLHFLNYLILDQGLLLSAVIEDVIKRPFITIGFGGLLMLIPLAITSTDGMRRRLGRRWKRLHGLIYLIGIAGVWHYYWQVKKDISDPLFYVLILALLLAYRLWARWRRRTAVPRAAQ